MKKVILLLFGLALFCVSNAQSYDLQYLIRKLNTSTDLSDEQRMQIVSLSTTYYPKAMEIQNSQSSDEIKYVKAIALKKSLDIDLKKILSSVQFDSYKKMCDEYEQKYLKQTGVKKQ